MIKAVIFDLGDTVINSDWRARNEAMLKETGVSVKLTDEIKAIYKEASKGRKELKDVFAKIIKEEGLKVDVNWVVERYKINYEKYSSVENKAIEIIKKLRKKVKVYALSNTNKIHKEVNQKRGVFGYFDDSFLSCDLGLTKDSPEIFNLVIKKIKLLPGELLFIDDNIDNVNMAMSVGMQAFQYKSMDDLKKKLKELEIM